MGCCASSIRPPPAPPSAGVRVVHLNGHVEELHAPTVTAADAISGQPEDVVLLCATTDPAAAASSATPIPPDAQLQADNLYLLIPRSVFASASSSPAELAALVKRLEEVAADEATFVEHRQVGEDGTATAGRGGMVPPLQQGNPGKGVQSWKPGLEDVIEENKSPASGAGDSGSLAEKKPPET